MSRSCPHPTASSSCLPVTGQQPFIQSSISASTDGSPAHTVGGDTARYIAVQAQLHTVRCQQSRASPTELVVAFAVIFESITVVLLFITLAGWRGKNECVLHKQPVQAGCVTCLYQLAHIRFHWLSVLSRHY